MTRRFCVCGQDLSRVVDDELALLGFCSESCLVHGDPDPSTDDEWRESFDDEDDGGLLDG